MLLKIYKNNKNNTLYIEGVTSGLISEFNIERNNDLFSIWRIGGSYYEIKNIHYSSFLDKYNQSFENSDLLHEYLLELLIPNVEYIQYCETVTVTYINNFIHLLNYIPKHNSVRIFLNGIRENSSSFNLFENRIDFAGLELGVGDQITIDYLREI
jgi:hypothetical protein